jgi:hypothetical protein
MSDPVNPYLSSMKSEIYDAGATLMRAKDQSTPKRHHDSGPRFLARFCKSRLTLSL